MSDHLTNSGANPESPTVHLPIDELISRRLKELGLKKSDFVKRWGYSNLGKGLRRLDEIRKGSFKPNNDLLIRLASGLELPIETVRDAFLATDERRQRLEEEEREREWDAWCRNFQPHAILTTDQPTPRPIFVACLIGVEKLLRVDFDFRKSQQDWVSEVVSKLPDSVIAFGQVTGFTINYSPYRAIEFDRAGRMIKERDSALRPGQASFVHKGKDVTSQWQAVFRHCQLSTLAVLRKDRRHLL